MLDGSRERISLDLRGLGPAIRAHTRAKGTTVSAVARLAFIKLLSESGAALEQPAAINPADGGPAVKLTVRIPKAIAAERAARSQATGLSYGGYLSMLMAAAPSPHTGFDAKQTAIALARSTDQLAVLAADLGPIARLTQHGVLAGQTGDVVDSLTRELRTHLGLAARLMSDLQPIAAWRRAGRKRSERRAHS